MKHAFIQKSFEVSAHKMPRSHPLQKNEMI